MVWNIWAWLSKKSFLFHIILFFFFFRNNYHFSHVKKKYIHKLLHYFTNLYLQGIETIHVVCNHPLLYLVWRARLYPSGVVLERNVVSFSFSFFYCIFFCFYQQYSCWFISSFHHFLYIWKYSAPILLNLKYVKFPLLFKSFSPLDYKILVFRV